MLVLLTLGVALTLASCTSAPSPDVSPQDDGETATNVLYAWVQQGAGVTASARAIIPAGAGGCPAITVNGTPQAMTQRTTSPTNFTEITVCEYPLSTAAPPIS